MDPLKTAEKDIKLETNSITVEGVDYPIKRLVMGEIITLMRLVRDGLGDLFDVFQGKVTGKDAQKLRELNSIYTNKLSSDTWKKDKTDDQIDEEITNLAIQIGVLEDTVRAQSGFSITSILDTLIDKHQILFEISGMAINKPPSWVEKNLHLDQFTDIVMTVFEQEFTTSFFERLKRGQNLLNSPNSIENPSNGSGPSLPS